MTRSDVVRHDVLGWWNHHELPRQTGARVSGDGRLVVEVSGYWEEESNGRIDGSVVVTGVGQSVAKTEKALPQA